MDAPHRQVFRHILPESRLGQHHDTLGIFRKASAFTASQYKEYTLIVVTDTSARRILLGKKHRGFGTGFYNSFGGKLEARETVEESAQRELHEETGISLPIDYVSESKVGKLFFTFADSPTEMIVHLFRVHISCDSQGNENYSQGMHVDPSVIRGCDEITPYWFDYPDLPLHTMFADDSVWLTYLLSSPTDVLLDAWFHFAAGGCDTNTILHAYLDIRNKTDNPLSITDSDAKQRPLNLEKRLFHELHETKINSPTIKEFNEAFAFVNALRIDKDSLDIVIDVAGGHGALAALFLITTSARKAVVVDPAMVGGGGVQRAWGDYFRGKQLAFRHECLLSGLPVELEHALRTTPRERILVVACHACQHLSDEIVDICCSHGVAVAVMPCCQRDSSPGSSWKAASKNLGVPVQYVMDFLLAGKAMSWHVGREAGVQYDVRMRVVNSHVTPQNRLIFCRPSSASGPSDKALVVAKAHEKLEKAYKRAHSSSSSTQPQLVASGSSYSWSVNLVTGFALGFAVAAVFHRRS